MIYLNLGRREVGKTTLARYLAARHSPQLVIDPRVQWDTADPIRRPSSDLIVADLDAGENVIVQPIDVDDASAECANAVLDYLIESDDDTRELSIVLDESSLIADLHDWSYIFRGSPRDRTTIVLTTHRPQDVPTFVRALADYWCIFRITQEHDLAVVRARCGDRVADLVTTLGPFEFVSWDDARGTFDHHRDGSLWRKPPTRDIPRPVSRLWG